MTNIILGALGAIRFILLGALPASAARWVELILTIAEAVVPLVERFTSDEFRELPGGRKGHAVVATVRRALDTMDDVLWDSLSEERKDALLDAVKEIALFIIDAAAGTLDRKAERRGKVKGKALQVAGLSDLAVAAAMLLDREARPVDPDRPQDGGDDIHRLLRRDDGQRG